MRISGGTTIELHYSFDKLNSFDYVNNELIPSNQYYIRYEKPNLIKGWYNRDMRGEPQITQLIFAITDSSLILHRENMPDWTNNYYYYHAK